jgi:hypothetical protein
MTRLAERVYFPLAVYVATFADGSTARISFGRRRKDGSPDTDRGRSFVELLYCSERKPLPMGGYSTTEKTMGKNGRQWKVRYYTPRDHGHQIETPGHKPKPAIVDGWIEFQGQTYRDPHFAGEQATVSHVLAAALEQARRLAA